MIEAPENQSINHSKNQSNQFATQVNDDKVYETMQQVIKASKEKVQYDSKKEEADEEEKEGEGEEKESIIGKFKGSQSMIQRRKNFLQLNKEFKNIFNKDNSNINDKRRCLIHMIIIVGVINSCAWEIDCLFFNVCYGEKIEMEEWISISLFPLIILSIFLLFVLNASINYLKRTLIMVCTIIYLILSIFSIVLGIISIFEGCTYKVENAEKVFKDFTEYEKNYYSKKSDNLRFKYFQKMVGSGILDLIIGVAGVAIFFMTLLFTSYLSKTAFDWRPPLRSHIRFSRIKKAVRLYSQNYDSFLNLFRAENPNYQIDEIEAKEAKNRFAAIRDSQYFKKDDKKYKEKESDKESFNLPKTNKKKKKEKSESSKEKDEEDDGFPRIKKKKNVLKRIIQNNSSDNDNNKKSEDDKNNNNINHINENNNNNTHEINTGINNNNKKVIEEEINTDIKINNIEEI